jgi:uncharacterized caspase-like protein
MKLRRLVLPTVLLLASVAGHAGLSRPEPEKPGTLHVLAIGIDKYSFISFQYCKADAEALASAMKRPREGTFAAADVRLLLDDEATRDKVQAAFESLIAQAKPADTVFIYVAGAGWENPETGDYEFFPRDYVMGENGAPGRNAVPGPLLKSWLDKIQAKNQVIVFDTGFLESAINALTARQSAIALKVAQLSGRNLAIFGASGLEPELEKVGHGAFTYALLEGLSGKADTAPRDGKITARELEAYVYTRLLAMSTGEAPWPPRALTYIRGKDFPLLFLEKVPPAAAVPTRGTESTEETEGVAEGTTATPAKPARNDYAVLFASNRYTNLPPDKQLANPVPDAHAIAQELRDHYGFQVEVVENPTVDTIITTLARYADMKYGDGDQLLVLFAGHGTYDDRFKQGFLLGSDSKADDPTHRSYLSHDDLQHQVDNLPAKHILVIIDACFGGTFQQLGHGGRGDDEYTKKTGEEYRKDREKWTTRSYLTSGGKEYVSDGIPGHHSPFAAHLLEALRTDGEHQGYLTFSRLASDVQTTKPEPIQGQWGQFEPGGDFVLIYQPRPAGDNEHSR